MKKTLSIVLVAILILAFAIPAFAADETIIIKNLGTTRAPIFTTENGMYVYCLERDKKAPAAEGTTYSVISNEEIASLRTLAINARNLSDNTSATITAYAVWGIIENEVESYRALTAARFGDEGVSVYDSLFASVEGNFEVFFTVYGADEEHQKMVSFSVSEVFAEEEEETTVTTTEPETEPEVEETTIPTTTPETEPEEEETTVTTTVPETEPEEETTVTTTTPGTEPEAKVYASEEVVNPHTGGVSTKAAAVAAFAVIVVLGSAFAAKKINDKKYDCR